MPIVRVVGVAEVDLGAVRDRADALPADVHATLVPAGANLVVTLTRRYGPTPGARLRAVRRLQSELVRVIGPQAGNIPL